MGSLSGKRIDIDKIKERKRLSVLMKDKKGYQLVMGKDAEKIRDKYIVAVNQIDEVRGEIGSLGIAQGKAKIVTGFNDIAKIKEGDILITHMTMPDYLPAMKKAAAFVTDEGGITCHAAIVAREMNKPCVIGTKIATKVFKDGEVVIVDATKGLVKKAP